MMADAMANPTAAWRTFLASPSAPKTVPSPLELDGYLTGIIVTPQPEPILPSTWLLGLWGDEEPIFDDAQMTTVLHAVMEHYNALAAAIDGSLKRLETDRICDWRPLFLSGDDKPAHDAVRRWVGGFWKAMALAPATWRALATGERSRTLIAPFVGFFNLEDQGAFAVRDDVEAVLDADAAAIPQTVLALRKLAQLRRRPVALARRPKVGRNNPCPCGSGQKYKRCCGQN